MKRMLLTKQLLLTVLMTAVAAAPVFAQNHTREEVERRIRESISEEEFQRMQEIRRQTGQTWSHIFDNVIEPDREDDNEINRSDHRYIMSEEGRRRASQQSRSAGQLAIDVNSASPEEAQEKPISVKDEPKPRRRQGIYAKDGKRREPPQEETVELGPDGLPVTAVRARAMAARAEQDAAAEDNPDRRRSFLYSSSHRSKSGKAAPEENAGAEAEEEEEYDGFGAKVLGKGTNKIFGEREDRFKGFGSKKTVERRLFRSGTITNDDRRTTMFGEEE
ncbi:MAG: hypothetical protein KC897_04030 [Candidatus Omnitrophica bacterium]|nr:hypothetical protein [Candidatus Omnitrophota bacterium]MCB9720565.1 hypothetical protein [Candidatus Omnitrophota bacterium]